MRFMQIESVLQTKNRSEPAKNRFSVALGMNMKTIYADSSEFPAKCPCAFIYNHLPVLILSVDSDWLISIKLGQSLTGNRNYVYLCQSWSNFDQVRQSGVYTITVSKSKSVKVTWSNFDQVNSDNVNRLLLYPG